MSVQFRIKKIIVLYHSLKMYMLLPQKVCLLRKIERYIHSLITGLSHLNQTKICKNRIGLPIVEKLANTGEHKYLS